MECVMIKNLSELTIFEAMSWAKRKIKKVHKENEGILYSSIHVPGGVIYLEYKKTEGEEDSICCYNNEAVKKCSS